jgi:hypothetical protein
MVGTISQFAGIYRERVPHGALRQHVRCVWVNDITESQNEWIRVVPDGRVDIYLDRHKPHRGRARHTCR